ncbi:MAG TPA: competence protein CoiA family protein [Arthrobacter sp.]
MPLTATRNGERLESPFINQSGWVELKKTYRLDGLLMSCGQDGVPKTSSRGLQYFAHKAKSDCIGHVGGSESPQHLEAKAIIAAAVRAAAGWAAHIEFVSFDRSWIADVLAESEGTRIALEVQWSRQSSADFSSRQERYASAGIKCFWFVSPVNLSSATESGVPFLVFSDRSNVGSVQVRRAFGEFSSTPLAEAVGHVLAIEFKRRIDATATHAVITASAKACGGCGRESSIYYVSSIFIKSKCGEVGALTREIDSIGWYYSVEAEVLDAVRATFLSEGFPPPAPIVHPLQDRNDVSHMAVCHRCSRWLGDPYSQARKGNVFRLTVQGVASIDIPISYRDFSHVCIDNGHGKCRPGRNYGSKGAFFMAKDVDWDYPLKGKSRIRRSRATFEGCR